MDNAKKSVLNSLHYLKGLNCSTLYTLMYKQWYLSHQWKWMLFLTMMASDIKLSMISNIKTSSYAKMATI